MILSADYRQALVRAVNRGGRWLANSRLRVLDFSMDRLMAEAAERAGADDFGTEDFVSPLSLLLDSLAQEARLNLIGRLAMRQEILQSLVTRLQIEADRKRHPALARAGIESPIFIIGLPRSGTTLLHNLLAEDTALRAPAGWEVMFPSPPVGCGMKGADRRIARAQRRMEWLHWLAPEFDVIHPLQSVLPQECIAITSYAFTSDVFPTLCHVPSYQRWLESADLAPSYRYHRRFLQHLQAGSKGLCWVLKAPAHLFAIPAIRAVYPDARFVHLHRDPLQVLPSVANLTLVLRGAFSDHRDPAAIGREVTRRWSLGISQALDALNALPDRDTRCCDMSYQELASRPLAAVERLYRHFGLGLSEPARQRMAAYLRRYPQNKQARHRYSLRQFGLDSKEIGDLFSEYRDAYVLGADAVC